MRNARSRRLAIATLVAAATACGPRPAPVATPPASTTGAPSPASTSGSAALGAQVEARFVAADGAAIWSVHVERADTRDVVVSRNAARLVLPASNMKIVTLAAAASRLGWDYRFRTTIHTTGTRNGHVLRGDLVVVGGADPTIGYGADPLATMREWARALRAAGIDRIEGDLVGDPFRFGDAWLGDSWSWDDLGAGYAAPYSGLIFHENVVRLRIRPGSAAGAPARVTSWPVDAGLHVDARVETTASGAATVTTTRALHEPVVEVKGHVTVGAPPLERLVAVQDPARYFLAALRTALADEGIEVRGRTQVARVEAATLGTPVVQHDSAPLADVAQRFMKVSQNLYGEAFLRVLTATPTAGASLSPSAPTPSSAIDTLDTTLAALGVPTGSVAGRDGSGLSRRDFVTAQAIVTLLHRMAEPPHREAFRATLPIAGTDGTLANRFKGNPCAGRLLAKTGTLSHVRALSGYITSASGTPYVFSVIANNFLAPTREIDAIVEDALGLVCGA